MLSTCMFCKFPFIRQRDVKKDGVVEGRMTSDITCSNCGAEFRVIVTIERGPAVRNYVQNQADNGGK
jgi:hypothetical protein